LPLRSISLRLAGDKTAGIPDRADRLRRGRATAPALRDLFPDTTHVTVRLQFLGEEVPRHAEQSFVLYPAARAYFGFPCPYGDCDGIFDLREAAQSALQQPALESKGMVECNGVRSRHRLARQPCGLQVRYTVTAAK
jgi:hypothetical protein